MSISSVIIIGGGCAGLSAAIYCGRSALDTIVFAGNLETKGGMLTKTSVVENYPGFPDGILGQDLIDNMENQAKKYGAEIIDSYIVKTDFSSYPYSVYDEDNKQYYAKSIIIATGSTPNKLYIKDEDKFWGNGISSCAVCDGALYRDKNILVVGGGDSAIEEALFLTKYSNVTLVHRRDTFGASKIMQKKLFDNKKISIIYDSIVEKIEGTTVLQKVFIKNLKTNQVIEMPVDGMFYGLGLLPNTKIFKDQLKLDNSGYIENNHGGYTTMTSKEGIFVAGDSNDHLYRQAIVACGDGCRAALDANLFLSLI